MKTVILVVLLGASVMRGFAQKADPTPTYVGAVLSAAQDEFYRQQQAQIAAQQARERQEQLLRLRIGYEESAQELRKLTSNPSMYFRLIDGTTNGLASLEFISGKVQQVLSDGLLISTPSERNSDVYVGSVVFLKNYPAMAVDNQQISAHAKLVGRYTYSALNGANRTVASYDCGTPVEPTPDQLKRELTEVTARMNYYETQLNAANKQAADARAATEARKLAGRDAALKSNQDSADRGEAYGLLRMGERYRDGEGVPKDVDKARDYLQRAVDAGSITAAGEIKLLPP